MINHPNRSVSRKLIADWSWDVSPGIYTGTETVRLYEDRALHVEPYVKWVGNSGGYAERNNRITGRTLAALLQVAAQQVADECDYTDRVRDILYQSEIGVI